MLPMFKRCLAQAARPGGAQGTVARVVLPLGALLFLGLLIAASQSSSSSSSNSIDCAPSGGLFCNSALRQRAEAAERLASAAETTAAALCSSRADAQGERAATELRAGAALALDLVLPLTNLSSLTTARVLDAARAAQARGDLRAAALPARLRAAVQGHQALACASGAARPSDDMSAVRFGNATLYVYKGNDIVSDHLAGEGHMWEEQELREFLWAIRAPVPGRPDGFPGGGGGGSGSGNGGAVSSAPPPPPPPLAIDIGANIGWFMLNAAAAGARVAAFEAMDSNVRLLRATLCANPDLTARVALYATGVGSEETECVMISGNVNRGDGHTICGEQTRDLPKLLAELKRGSGYEYASRGKMTVRRLDRMLLGGGSGGGGGGEGGGGEQDDDDDSGGNAAGGADDDNGASFSEAPAVVKIDIEGFEEQALRGADGLLLNPRTRPWFLLTEANLGMLKDGGADYMRFLKSRGYALSQESFRGPFFTDASVERGESGYSGQNLYCTRRDWLETAEGRRALGGRGARYVGVFPAEGRERLEG